MNDWGGGRSLSVGKAVKSMKIQVKAENSYPIFHIFQSFPVGQIGVFAEQSVTPPEPNV